MDRRLFFVSLIVSLVICIIPASSIFAVESKDGAVALDEFTVSESVYNAKYKDNPDYETIGSARYYRYLSRTRQTATSGYETYRSS